MADLAELLDRVKAATGPNYQLEVDIARQLGVLQYGVTGAYFPPPTYTASLDAALALVERVLPDAPVIAVSRTAADGWGAGVNGHVAIRPTAALSLLAALLSALKAQPASGDVGSTPKAEGEA